MLAFAVGGCGESKADLAAAKTFDRFPLYWAGDRFEKWDLERSMASTVVARQ